MRRVRIAALLGVLLLTAPLMGHFVYIVPASNESVKVIFSDSMEPDTNVSIEKIAASKVMIAQAGKLKPAEWTLKKDEGYYEVQVPGDGSRVVLANTDYGVFQRGTNQPIRLQYHSRTILGPLPAPEELTFAKEQPLELIPQVVEGKLTFRALLNGKPLAKAEYAVMAPESERALAQTTDAQGFTAKFEKGGTYSARVLFVDAKPGEFQGKAYNELRHYATVVYTWSPAK
ncbi:DUF4198 domain-containing protein [Tuwongella immobilis]|uniref:DUF4198 domain-containing protein n=1 Tax=Tuwongella immobilis TaxID=692036 RepID=A0A6C2YMB5_9BACT|nr:DUF4198 domain-containing protein [Tuwongella immobilis]VIP02062.1 Uncharacterized protein OS=Singulisphaera acidiphila (strain ATCC BAA-1392 / DSM 18658 / VKM B-2454 / MOB10) GN=Sinac_6476 PE=4 SV=1 [Tuwongella immobilis]VTS00273.1 Uncharacterized protein OS=Singulisphaera acidiphila (strain ATCC BAA-1392 / DSM 18658 / VKM B-2454 / MOB10) GN=Sinac_6476 PE=4 SV=1 [Tuwongella immobilis]